MNLSELPGIHSELSHLPRIRRYRPVLTVPGVGPKYLVVGAWAPIEGVQAPTLPPGIHRCWTDENRYPVVFLDPSTLEIRQVLSQPNNTPCCSVTQVSDQALFLNPAGSIGPASKQSLLAFPSSHFDFDSAEDLVSDVWEISVSSNSRGKMAALMCSSLGENWSKENAGNDSVYPWGSAVEGEISCNFVTVVGDIGVTVNIFCLAEEKRPRHPGSLRVNLIASLHREGVLAVDVAEIPWRKQIVCAGKGKILCFDDLVTVSEVGRGYGHDNNVNCLSVSSSYDFDVVLSGSDDGTTRIWDCRTFEAVQVLSVHSESEWRAQAVFSALDCRIVGTQFDTGDYTSGDGTIHLWDIRKPNVPLKEIHALGDCLLAGPAARHRHSLVRVSSDSVVSTNTDFSVGTFRFRIKDGKILASLPSLKAADVGLVYEGDWESRVETVLSQGQLEEAEERIRFVLNHTGVVLKLRNLRLIGLAGFVGC